jgi:protein TonB
MRVLAVGAVAMLGAGASPPPPAPAPAPAAPLKSISLDDYKRALAGCIVASSPAVFRDPLPRTMKSIVVLHIRVDRRGRPTRVAVFRSNGYRALERRAVASVVGAGPLPPPPDALLDDTSSLSFLETFLFRDDDRFQVRSLVP